MVTISIGFESVARFSQSSNPIGVPLNAIPYSSSRSLLNGFLKDTPSGLNGCVHIPNDTSVKYILSLMLNLSVVSLSDDHFRLVD